MFAIKLFKQGRQIYRPVGMVIRTKTFKDGGQHATFNDVPIPQGSWKADNDRKQKLYNMVFLSGIATFIGTIVAIRNSKFNLYSTVPDYPYEDTGDDN